MTEETKDERPVIVIAVGDKPRVRRAIKNELIKASAAPDCPASDMVFRLGSTAGMVHLNRNEIAPADLIEGGEGRADHDADYHVDQDLLLRTATPGWFGDLAERKIEFQKTVWDKEAKVFKQIPTEPTEKLLQSVGEIVTAVDFPPLRGTTETPTLREDRSLLTVPGYDRKSGLYYDPAGADFPTIPDKPTKVDARTALELFTGERGILRDFPFRDDVTEPKGLSLAVAMAMLLTCICRRTLANAPLFAINANEPDSGKTLLAHVGGALATGRQIAVRVWKTEEYQREAALAGALEAGDPVLLFDNLGPAAPITGDCINAILTSPVWMPRRFGHNDAAHAMMCLTNSTFITTGNHIVVNGDMTAGRTLLMNLIPELPKDQRTYIYRNLLKHVLANRPQLVAALLTILRGYAVASDKFEPTKFRFPEWADLVAAAVQWLGLPNPTLAAYRAKVSDPERDVQEDVIRAWSKKFGSTWLPVQTLIDASEIATPIAGWLGIGFTKLTFKSANPFLTLMIGKPLLGFRVERRKGDGHTKPAMWRLGDEHPNRDRHAEFRAAANEAESTAEDDFGTDPIEDGSGEMAKPRPRQEPAAAPEFDDSDML